MKTLSEIWEKGNVVKESPLVDDGVIIIYELEGKQYKIRNNNKGDIIKLSGLDDGTPIYYNITYDEYLKLSNYANGGDIKKHWDKEYRDGGSISSDRRFTEWDFNKLMASDKFRAVWSGNLWEIIEEGRTRVLGKFNPKTKSLYILGDKNMDNFLVVWMTENGFVNSNEYTILANGGGIGNDLKSGNVYSKKMPYYYRGEITEYTIQPIVIDDIDDKWVYYQNYQMPSTAEKMPIFIFKQKLDDGTIKPYSIKDLHGDIDRRLNTFLHLLYLSNLADYTPFTKEEFEKIKGKFNYERHNVELNRGRRGFFGDYTDDISIDISRNDWTNSRRIHIYKIVNGDKLNEPFNKIIVSEQDNRDRDSYFIYDNIDDFIENHETNMEMGGGIGNDWFWNHAYRHYMRDASLEQRNKVKAQFIKEGLELDGESPRHSAIISSIVGEYANGGGVGSENFYALTSDGMRNKKRAKILIVQYWKGRETNHAPTLENIKEFLLQVPFDEKIVIYADEDYIDDSTSFYGQLHSAYTPLYTAGAITVDAIVDENNNMIWNLYAKGKHIINVDYKFKNGGGVSSNYKKFGKENPRLVNFNIDDLDYFESMQYEDFIKSMDKASALQILINNVEGDYSQLSEKLAEIAEEQYPSDEYDNYANGGAIKTDFNELQNTELRNVLISFWNDFFNNNIGNYLSIEKENYILSNIDNVFVIVRDEDKGNFSNVEKQNIDRFLSPYFDSDKKPLFTDFFNNYEIKDNKIIIYMKAEKMYANGGGVDSYPFNLTILVSNKDYAKIVIQKHNGVILNESQKDKGYEFALGSYDWKVLDKIADELYDKGFFISQYANGGMAERIDLFEDYENIPTNIQEILDEYSEDFEDGNYEGLANALQEVEAEGYTFEYYLDGQAYGLRPIDVPLNQLKGYEDMGEEYANGGGVGNYEIYHDTLASCLREVENYAQKKGYNIGTYFPTINHVSYGTTHRTTVDLLKDGKIVNTLNIQIYRMDSGRYELNMYSSNKMANGGGIETTDYSDLAFASKTFSKTSEMLVRENLNNGEICMCKLTKILGHEPNYPIQVVGSLKLEKCFMKRFYQIV